MRHQFVGFGDGAIRLGGRSVRGFALSADDTASIIAQLQAGHDAWAASNAAAKQTAALPDRLYGGQSLARGRSLVSPNGRFALVFQASDGNVVIYDTGGNPPTFAQNEKPGWRAIRAWGQGKTDVTMQDDGNFIIAPGWASDTNRAHRLSPRVQMQDDANLVVVIDDNPVWSSQTDGGNYHPDKNVLQKVGSAVSSVAAPVAHLVTSPISAAIHIAQGDNVLSTLANHFKDQVKNIKDVAPMAQAIVSFVPGVGSGINAAIAAGSALAQGQNISDALVSAAKNALPGGPLAAAAFDTAYKLGKAAATGGNIGDAALEAARAQVPGGAVAQQAFDTALALAHGQNVQQAITSGAVNLAQGQIANVASSIAPSLPIPALPSSITNAASSVVSAVNALPPSVKNVANRLVSSPQLQGLATEQAARALGTDVNTLNQAVAALTGQHPVQAIAGVVPLFKPNTVATTAHVVALTPKVTVAPAARPTPAQFAAQYTAAAGNRVQQRAFWATLTPTEQVAVNAILAKPKVAVAATKRFYYPYRHRAA